MWLMKNGAGIQTSGSRASSVNHGAVCTFLQLYLTTALQDGE